MNLTDIINIITALGVIGTLILGLMNQWALKKSERESRKYNLAIIDYEKRRDFLLVKVAEYIALLDAHKISFMALSDDEYEGKDMETYQHYYKLETCCYEIKLFLNANNPCFSQFMNILDESLSSAYKLRQENSMAEMITNGLRNPEIDAEAYERAQKSLNISDSTTTSSFIEEAKKIRDTHLNKYLLNVEQFSNYKKTLTDTARNYLTDEKNQVQEDPTNDK